VFQTFFIDGCKVHEFVVTIITIFFISLLLFFAILEPIKVFYHVYLSRVGKTFVA